MGCQLNEKLHAYELHGHIGNKRPGPTSLICSIAFIKKIWNYVHVYFYINLWILFETKKLSKGKIKNKQVECFDLSSSNIINDIIGLSQKIYDTVLFINPPPPIMALLYHNFDLNKEVKDASTRFELVWSKEFLAGKFFILFSLSMHMLFYNFILTTIDPRDCD